MNVDDHANFGSTPRAKYLIWSPGPRLPTRVPLNFGPNSDQLYNKQRQMTRDSIANAGGPLRRNEQNNGQRQMTLS